MKINYYGLTDIGQKRKTNQDSFICNDILGLFAVSDGMGGLAYGKQTSEEVIRLLNTFISFEDFNDLNDEEAIDLLKDILIEINTHIIEMGNIENRTPLYGATLTGVFIKDENIIVFNIGDSRVYQMRQEKLQRITADDSLLQTILNAEVEIDEDEMKAAAGILLQFMGMYPSVIPSIKIYPFHHHDTICICSDGLTSMLDDHKIEEILKQNISIKDKTAQLIQMANEAGGEDNITAIVIERGDEDE